LTTQTQAARGFRRLRLRLWRNQVGFVIAGSRLRPVMILACSAVFWCGLFGLFFEGFQFLGTFVTLLDEIINHLFGVFFLSLLVMLILSTGIILHTSLYSSREATFLMTMPVSADRVFAYKFVEAIGFSSWAFVLLVTPMLVSYGITVEAPWPFYLIMFGFLLAFVMIPGCLGAIGALLVARFVPRRRKTVVVASLLILLTAIIFLGARLLRTPGEVLTRDWLDALLGKLSFGQHPLLPSRWMSQGLIAAAAGEYRTSLFYLLELAANAGFFYVVAAILARDMYRSSYSRVQGGRESRRRIGFYAFDSAFHRVFFFVARPIRLLILKDIRTFRRDSSQWSQFLIFFGLLAFYFINIRRLGYHVQSEYWRNLLSFLNLSVTALLLSTFTSRFIFPMLSLEGRNFWILGLLPLSRAGILYGKFAFAAGISLIATEGLVVLSDWMLRLSGAMILLHMILVLILCLGLSAISVGLGARLPNLKEDDPSKIATGFGGTLNLLVSLIFILLIVSSLALPCHVFLASEEVNEASFVVVDMARFRFWLGVAMAASVVIGVIGTVVPLRVGIKAFNRMEL
jgi:ABC-2 type transport system permease protein